MFCFCIFIRILLYHRHTKSGMNILYFPIRPSGSYLLVFHPAGNYSRIYNKCLPEYWRFFSLEFRPSVRKCSLRWYSFRGHQSIVPVCSSPDYNHWRYWKLCNHCCKYNPQIQISAESETKRSIFREKDKTKRSKKESAQHSKSRNKSFVMTSVSAL